MDLNFYKPKELAEKAKLTVQKTGRLGLSKGAMKLLDPNNKSYIKFGRDGNNKLFAVVKEEADDNTFKLAKAGDYSYIAAKSLLEEMGIDYKSKDTIIFDISETNEKDIYELKKRVIEK